MIIDTTPVPRAGVNAVIGNRNPVSVVSTVVARKMQVQPKSRFPRSMPASTTRPVAMPRADGHVHKSEGGDRQSQDHLSVLPGL
jgi:hypothetical protein